MKRKNIKYAVIIIAAFIVGLILMIAVRAGEQSDQTIRETDAFVADYEANHIRIDLKDDGKTVIKIGNASEEETTTTEPVGNSEQLDIEQMDVWQLGSYLYGISELDTTRTLKIISREGYGDSLLSYYVACCCWVRASENYWGYGNLYQAFGEADTSYDEWMDGLNIEDYAYDALRECYLNPSYVKYCNGMMIPEAWVYEQDGIYVW